MTQFETPTEIWILIAVNCIGVFLGALTTAVSYLAYRFKNRSSAFRRATLGFGLITLGTACEPVYQLAQTGTHVLNNNIPLQILEATLIAAVFLLLFFSIYSYQSRTHRYRVTRDRFDDEALDDPD